MCGFYYTENDESVNVVWTDEVEENGFEAEIFGIGKYWYQTEKITDNWWFYEMKWLHIYSASR